MQPDTMQPDTVEITDLALAAFLTARGFPVLKLDGRPGRRTFYFPPGARDECRTYFAGAMIEARTFAEAMRSMKGMVHNIEHMG